MSDNGNVTEIRSMENAKPQSCAGKAREGWQHQAKHEKGNDIDNRSFKRVAAHDS